MISYKKKLRIYREHIAQSNCLAPSTKITIACLLHLDYDDLIKTSDIQKSLGYAPATSYSAIKEMQDMGIIQKVYKKTTYYWKFEDLLENKSL